MTPEELVTELFRHINGPAHRLSEALNTHLRTLHPTLQQAFVRELIRPALGELAGIEVPDDRNRSTLEWAVKALNATEDITLPTV